MPIRIIVAIFFSLLFCTNCAGQNIAQVGADEIAEVFQNMFDPFQSKAIKYSLQKEDQEDRVSEMELFVDICSKNSFRCICKHPPKQSDRGKILHMRQEYLFQANGQYLYGEQTLIGKEPDKARASIPSLTGKSNWKQEEPLAHQLYSTWLGYIIVGNECIDLRSKEFWKSVNLKQTDTGAICQSNGNPIELTTVKIKSQIVVSEVTFLAKQKDLDSRAIELQIKFLFDNSNGKLTGWILRDRYQGDPFKLGIVTKIDSMSEITEASDPLVFQIIDVPKGTEVFVKRQPNVHFQYIDGLFYRIIDGKAEQEIEKLKPADCKDSIDEESDRADLIARGDYLGLANAGHCGVYSFAAAAACLGVDVDLIDAIERKQQRDGKGMSTSDIRILAQDYGLNSAVVKNADFAFLSRTKNPGLLHLGKSFQPGNEHWVAFIGSDKNGLIEILDPPHQPEKLPPALLMTYWDGTLVLFSKTPISRIGTWRYRIEFVATRMIGVALVLLTFHLALRGLRSENLKFELASILMTTLFCSAAWLYISPISFTKNQVAVALTTAKTSSVGTEPRKTLDYSDVIEGQKKGAVLVDCRLSTSFAKSHAPGAISLPTNGSVISMMKFVEKHKDDVEIYVYCESEFCQWAHKTAAVLDSLGFQNVKIFEPGWVGIVKFYNAKKNLK